MSPVPKTVSGEIAEASLGSLSGCLVDGDAEQRSRERSIRRRSLAISILLQSAVLATLILVPLFGKAERISLTIVTPIPPYSPYRDVSQNPGEQRPRPHGPQNVCRFCPPLRIPLTIAMRDQASSTSETDETPFEGQGIPGAIDGLIPLSDSRQRVLPPPNTERQGTRPQLVHVGTINPAMLIHRVEPVYPALARQTHREGRVELRAIISTDGSIQSLQVVSGDALFLISAREAVQQWRYRPTILDGQPVEVDTYITVIYTTQH
ncbi:MAG TPA: energy transducer TonB [Candidatus Acidoferrum sp.]|nr:energy transducer TonB [Candidatus Acidoferrum sp.]